MLVVQNDVGNQHSPVIIVAAVTTKTFTKSFPTNVFLPRAVSGLRHDSTVMLNQIRTLDRDRLTRWLTRLDGALLTRVDAALRISLGL